MLDAFRRNVHIAPPADQHEVITERVHGIGCAVAAHRQSRALLRPVRGEGCGDDQPPGRHGRGERLSVRAAILVGDHEVEHGPVVPQLSRAQVGPDPLHMRGALAERGSGHGERARRDVENRDIVHATPQ